MLQDKLGIYREEPPLGIYTRVESSLAAGSLVAQEKRGGRRLWLYALSAAAVVAVMVTSSILFWTDGEVAQPTLSDYVAEVDMNGFAAERRYPIRANATPEEELVSGRMKALLQDTANVVVKHRLLHDESVPLSNMLAVNVDMPKDDVAEEVRSAMTENPTYRRAAEKARKMREKEIEQYWRDVFRESDEEDFYGTERRRGMTTSLFAGNFGAVNGDFNASGVNTIASNGMNVPESSGGDRYMRPAANVPKLQHKMPVSFGVNLAIPLGERLSLVTGVNYSYLFSKSSLEQFADYEYTRKLHYLGVPLGVSYDVWRNNRLSIYVYGGGMVERALYGKEQKKLDGEVFDTERLSIKGFQSSVNASVGTMYRFSPSMGLYFEPGVSYYFENLKQPANYRTENPTNVSLRLGVKFSLD